MVRQCLKAVISERDLEIADHKGVSFRFEQAWIDSICVARGKIRQQYVPNTGNRDLIMRVRVCIQEGGVR